MRVTLLIGCYSLCSSMLLILNKVAVTYVPAPSFILACQLGSCALFVKSMAVAGVVEAEPLQAEKARKFALIVFGFIGTLFASVTSLKVSFQAKCPKPSSCLNCVQASAIPVASSRRNPSL